MKRLNLWLTASVLCFALTLIAAPEKTPAKTTDLAGLFQDSEELFKLKSSELTKRFPQLQWQTGEKKTLYCPGRLTNNFCYGAEKVYDFQIETDNQLLSAVEITIYTRGDAGKLSRYESKEKLKTLAAALANLTGGTRSRRFGKLGNMRIQTECYTGKNLIAELEFISGKNDTPERITLKFKPLGTSGLSFRNAIKTHVHSSSLSQKQTPGWREVGGDLIRDLWVKR